MKLIYCIASVYNPGGMERVLLNKVRYLSAKGGYDLTVVTTDQHGRPPFYTFPEQVRMVDLGVNYIDDKFKHPLTKIVGYYRRRRWHRHRLTEFLLQEKADIVISLYPCESGFIPKIKDGSKKILELHQCKFVRLQYGRKGLLGLTDRYRTWLDERMVRKFDRFVVLTHEDAGYWGNLENLIVIPNAALNLPVHPADPSVHRVIAVGRLDHQKGFERLLQAWADIPAERRGDWRLDIFGQGEWKEMLEQMIRDLDIVESASICAPTQQIFEEYARSSILAMSSHYEGFPMVMIEAMACGLPVVTFGYKCGPKDIITDGVDGRIVEDGNIPALSAALEQVMNDSDLRTRMSEAARKVTARYSEKTVMQQWETCFQQLLA